jgi:hypothetical protein
MPRQKPSRESLPEASRTCSSAEPDDKDSIELKMMLASFRRAASMAAGSLPKLPSMPCEVTRSRAYKKNDQAFVEQKNGAVVRRLMAMAASADPHTAAVWPSLWTDRLHPTYRWPVGSDWSGPSRSAV